MAVIINTTKLLLGACYRPPDASSSFVSDLRNSLNTAVQLCPTHSICLFGDFNLPLINWDNLSSTCRTSLELINLTLDFNLLQVIHEPTRGNNILDLLLTTGPDTIGPVTHLNGFSDHDLLQIAINVELPFTGVSKKIIRDYNKANFSKINEELEIFFNDTLLPSFNNHSVEDNWICFKTKISDLINQYILLISITNDKSNPWFTKALRKLRNKKERLYSAAKRINSAPAWERYKLCLKSYCSALTEAKTKYFSKDLLSLLQTNPKKFWQVISPDRDSKRISLHSDTNVPLSDNDCSSAFNAFFFIGFHSRESY